MSAKKRKQCITGIILLTAAMARVNEADSILAEYPEMLQEIFNDEDDYIELKEDCQEKLDSLKFLLVSAKAKQEEAERTIRIVDGELFGE